MSIFDELDKDEDFVMFKGERIDMYAPELTEATLLLRGVSDTVEELPETATDEERQERNIRYSVELVKLAVMTAVPKITNLAMAAKFIRKTGGMAGEAAIKAVELCGWGQFYMYTVGREGRDKEDE